MKEREIAILFFRMGEMVFLIRKTISTHGRILNNWLLGAVSKYLFLYAKGPPRTETGFRLLYDHD
jgi:hypothetical protein